MPTVERTPRRACRGRSPPLGSPWSKPEGQGETVTAGNCCTAVAVTRWPANALWTTKDAARINFQYLTKTWRYPMVFLK